MITCSRGSEDIAPTMDFCEDVADTDPPIIVSKCDVSIQYCSSDLYICPNGKRSIGTQTLKSRRKRKRNESDRKIIEHAQSVTSNNNSNPLGDLNYCIPAPCSPPDLYLEHRNQSKMPMDGETELRSPDNDEEQCNVISSSENEDNNSGDDHEYHYHSSDCEESSDESGSEMNTIDHKTFIVFESQLNELFKFCQKCKSPVCELTKTTKGSMVTIKTLCSQHHDYTWQSQPTSTHKNIPAGNLLIPAAIVCTGGTFQDLSNFAEALQLNFISRSIFFDMQDNIILPVINKQYIKQQSTIITDINDGMPVDLCGDGRSDSPGHTAKYGTYSLMDEKSGKIVDFSLIHVSEVSSSNAMEYEGCKRSLDNLLNRKISIRCLTTDRHTQITAQLAKNYPSIKHQYDVWHLAKWVTKKLTKKAKTKANIELQPWIKSISNHMWWSAKECKGDPDVLVNNWISIVNHIADKHTWKEGK